jgi:hypothetical protein
MKRSRKTNKATLGSEWRGALKKSLTEPTLLEMSGNPTYQELACVAGVVAIGSVVGSDSNPHLGANRINCGE